MISIFPENLFFCLVVVFASVVVVAAAAAAAAVAVAAVVVVVVVVVVLVLVLVVVVVVVMVMVMVVVLEFGQTHTRPFTNLPTHKPKTTKCHTLQYHHSPYNK